MTENSPLVTILMAVYNGEKYLREAIESMLNQTYTNFEFLIINDGSIDATEEIILSYKDERIRYIKNEQNLKLIASLNKGLDLANGKYIARMDADDFSLPVRLEKQVEYLEKNPEIGVLGRWVEIIGKEEPMIIQHKTNFYDIRVELLFYNYLCHPSVMLNNVILKKHQLKYPNFLHAEDYGLWIQVAKYGKIEIIPELLLKYREHGENISLTLKEEQKTQDSTIRKLQLIELDVEFTDELFAEYEKLIDQEIISSKQTFKELIHFLSSVLKKLEDINLKTVFIRELTKKLMNSLLKIDWSFGLKEAFLVYFSKFEISARVIFHLLKKNEVITI
jgi:glycosyltransferase involved in cell wall biosynthesis